MKLKDNKYQEFIEQVTDWAESNGHSVQDSYSGRGMYGKRCFGVVVPHQLALLDLYFSLGYDSRNGDNFSIPPEPSTDSMGRDTIIYWPSLRMEVEDA